MSRHTYYEFTGHFYPVRILFAPYGKAFAAALHDHGITREPYPKNTSGRATHYTNPGHEDVIILTFSKAAETVSPLQRVGLMVHELCHVLEYIEAAIYSSGHVDPDGPMRDKRRHLDSESRAYLLQAMTMWLLSSYSLSNRGTDQKND